MTQVAENKQLMSYSRRGSYYTNEEKQHAAFMYLQYGNTVKVAAVTGIPQSTIADWVKRPWWQELITIVRQENKDELNGIYTRLLKKSADLIENQLNKGDLKALDAAKIHGIMFDKRQILNHEPTSITSSSKISDLQQQFETYMRAKDITADVVKTDNELDKQ